MWRIMNEDKITITKPNLMNSGDLLSYMVDHLEQLAGLARAVELHNVVYYLEMAIAESDETRRKLEGLIQETDTSEYVAVKTSRKLQFEQD